MFIVLKNLRGRPTVLWNKFTKNDGARTTRILICTNPSSRLLLIPEPWETSPSERFSAAQSMDKHELAVSNTQGLLGQNIRDRLEFIYAWVPQTANRKLVDSALEWAVPMDVEDVDG